MRRVNLLMAISGLLVGLIAATHWTLRAQGDQKTSTLPPGVATNRPTDPAGHLSSRSVQDALLRPFRFAFKKPITLEELAGRLKQELDAAVVLDLAALERLDVKPEETVALELDGVRLKTGLKLLLDQVGMTYRVVPEDNLLILTDNEGAEDPLDRLAAEIRELHRDVHEVQDAVDELRDLVGPSGDGARVRKPTIIEELPESPESKPHEKNEDPPSKPRAEPRPETRQPGTPSARPRTRL